MHSEDVSLKHTLTDKEMGQLARDQAGAIEKRMVAESELGAIKKDYAGRIALANAEIGSISARVNSGWEMRNVKCLLVDERPNGYRLIIRTDNGHIARRRKLEPEERQMKLTDSPPAPGSGPTLVALLPIDDENWAEDFAEVPLYEDEAAALKDAGIQFRQMVPNRLQIEAGPVVEKPMRKRGKGKK